jgi:hypothetical protein
VKTLRLTRHGRDAGYPTPPVQTRTCSVPASGSSVALAAVQGRTLMAMARREVGSYDSGPTCPGCVACPGGVRPSRPSPGGGLSPPQSTLLDTTPQPHPVGVPVASTSPPASHLGRRGTSVPALFRLRVSPAVPQELSTISRRFPRVGAAGVSQVLQRLSSCLPWPEDSGGPFHPRP